MVVWKTIRKRIAFILFLLRRNRDVTVIVQSGDAVVPNRVAVRVEQSVNVKGHAKNRLSMLSSGSPHNIQPCVIPHCRIRTLMESLSLNINQTMKAWRGTPCVNQTRWGQGTSGPRSLICSQVLTVEKWSLQSSSLCLHKITSLFFLASGFCTFSESQQRCTHHQILSDLDSAFPRPHLDTLQQPQLDEVCPSSNPKSHVMSIILPVSN